MRRIMKNLYVRFWSASARFLFLEEMGGDRERETRSIEEHENIEVVEI